jgi:hypothetical protein
MKDLTTIGADAGRAANQKEMSPTKYKGITIEGSTFPDDPYQLVKVKLNTVLQTEYIPALRRVVSQVPLQLLLIAMTHVEGFNKGTRAYRTNNPGNIGNTDSGKNKKLLTLDDGVKLQADFITRIALGNHKMYPLGKLVHLKPFYSPEIAKNPQYGLPPHLPGYKFVYTGQIDQFVKIYSTGARVTNNYVDTIVSYFKMNGVTISPTTTLKEIVGL